MSNKVYLMKQINALWILKSFNYQDSSLTFETEDLSELKINLKPSISLFGWLRQEAVFVGRL